MSVLWHLLFFWEKLRLQQILWSKEMTFFRNSSSKATNFYAKKCNSLFWREKICVFKSSLGAKIKKMLKGYISIALKSKNRFKAIWERKNAIWKSRLKNRKKFFSTNSVFISSHKARFFLKFFLPYFLAPYCGRRGGGKAKRLSIIRLGLTTYQNES